MVTLNMNSVQQVLELFFFKTNSLFFYQRLVNSKNCLQGNLVLKSLEFSFSQFTEDVNLWVILVQMKSMEVKLPLSLLSLIPQYMFLYIHIQ